MEEKLLEFGDDAAEKASKYFNCIMLFILGILIMGIPLSLCAIFGIPIITALGALLSIN